MEKTTKTTTVIFRREGYEDVIWEIKDNRLKFEGMEVDINKLSSGNTPIVFRNR